MQSSYRLKANELDEQFIAGLKATYKDKDIEIIVYEINETEYLLKSDANRNRLMEAKANIENKTNLIEIDLEDLE
jgi:antitoxin YefM